MADNDIMADWVTSKQAADLLGVSASQVRHWAAAGRIVPACRPTARLSLFRRADVLAFVRRPVGHPRKIVAPQPIVST